MTQKHLFQLLLPAAGIQLAVLHGAPSRLIRLVPPPEGCRLPSRPLGSSGRPLTLTISSRVTRPLRSTGITPLHHYYGAVRTWPAPRYFRPRGTTTCAFSLLIADQGLKFRARARIRVTPPIHRTPHGQ